VKQDKLNQKLRTVSRVLLFLLVCLPVIAVLVMLLFILGVSFMDPSEIKELWDEGASAFHILPAFFSVHSWKTVLNQTPEYLLHFWDSVWISLPSVIGSVVVSVITAYGLTNIPFRGKRVLFLLMALIMLLPYQATLVPNYLLLDILDLIGTQIAVILPNVFHPLGIIAMAYFMEAVPKETVEAARVDGAGEFRIFAQIVIPQVRGGVAILALYVFLDSWNLVEPILVLVQDAFKYPLSVALNAVSNTDVGIWAVCSVLFVIPALIIFGMTGEQLIDGLTVRKKE